MTAARPRIATVSILLNQASFSVSGVAKVSAAPDKTVDLTELGLHTGRDHDPAPVPVVTRVPE